MRTASELLIELRQLGVHLQMEGDVLRLSAPKGALTPALQVALKEHKAELLHILNTMRFESAKVAALPLERTERKPLMPLSFAQQRIWFLNQLEPGSPVYNLLAGMRMQGALDAETLERSLQAIISRHEDLRTCFVQQDGTPYTVIRDGADWRLHHFELDKGHDETLDEAITRFTQSTTQKPFDLETGPLFRAYVLKVQEDDYIFIVSVHHIVSDGWSMGVLVQELAENYRALSLGELPKIKQLPLQYVDYAVWQQRWFDTGVLEQQLRYWKKQLQDAPEVSIFPVDHPRSTDGVGQTGVGKRLKVVLPAHFVEELHAFSRSHDATLFMTMLAAFFLLMRRFAGQEDLVIGTPSANRGRAEVSELIGFFVNNLAIRTKVEEGISCLELLRRVRESTLGAYEHQDLPFDHLVRELQTQRDPDYSPLFQTMFILQNFPLEELKLPNLVVTPKEIDAAAARFDLSVEIYPYRGELLVYFDYRVSLYEESTMRDLQLSYEKVLRSFIQSPDALIESIPILTSAMKAEVVESGIGKVIPTSDIVLLLAALDRNFKQMPGKRAVKSGAESFTYSQLTNRVEQLASQLRERGVRKGSLVPVLLHRSVHLPVALLAVLKAGAAYVPLDPIYPKQRICGIVSDVQPATVITESSLMPLVRDFQRACLLIEDLTEGDIQSREAGLGSVAALSNEAWDLSNWDDAAYVIYTSGSTGKPKGVEISHGALANFLHSMREEPGFSCDDKILAVTTVSFDIAGLELFLPLYSGGELVIARDAGNLEILLDELTNELPTIVQATPALWKLLLSSGWEGDCRLKALCGGEALSSDLAESLRPRVGELWNMYGPTETTIWSLVVKIEETRGSEVPIGRPIANTQCYVLDSNREVVPFGVAGELYIGGEGLATGYLHQPELTSDRFVHFPSDPGKRIYRTGDLVRRRRDGLLDFLGRSDFQVKLRGFRIELGEIEHALRQQPEVREGVVVMSSMNGDAQLTAYIVLELGEALPYQRLRQRLREKLPEYMVPSTAVMLEALPRLPNGKLDRSSLPSPESREVIDQAADQQEARTPTERAITRVLSDLLRVSHLGIHQRFFEMGAHSLLLVKAHIILKRELDPQLQLVSFFQFPSIAALAADVDRRQTIEREHAYAELS